MTAPADDSAVEEAFEAYLAGRAVPSSGDRLASFADAVRASATEPGRPSVALADLLTTGLLTDQPGPSARTARRPRRRRSRMLAPAALFTKLATAGLAAKAATVAGVAVVGLTTVGFTGNLGPAQHGFATLVDHATPFTVPDPATATTQPEPSTTATTDGGSATSGDQSGTSTAPATPTQFGQQVSQMAHDNKANGTPGVDGQAVSSMARSRHNGSADDGTDSGTSAGDDGTDGSSAAPAVPSTSSKGHGGSSGKGHGNR